MATLHWNLTGNARGLGRALSLAQRDMNHTMRESQRLSRAMRGGQGAMMLASQGAVAVSTAFKAASIAAAGMGIAVLGVTSVMVKHSAELESAIMRVAAVSGATDGQVAVLTARAFDLGKTFGVSGKEAAEAMTFLAMAGNDAEASMKLAASAMMLASVGAIDAGRAADITTNIMAGMRLEASDMDSVVDILANTITGFNVNMTMMGDGFKDAAPAASALGISVAELSSTLGLLGNAGLQGEKGGTILRNVLLRLTNTTHASRKIIKKWGKGFDMAAIKANGLSGVIRSLTNAGATMPDLAKVFGTRAISGILALLDQGADRMEYFTDQVQKSGTAAEINDRIMQTFEKRFASAKTAILEASNTIAEEWRDALLLTLDTTEKYIKTLGITDDALTKFGQKTVMEAMNGMIWLVDASFKVAKGFAFLWDTVKLVVNAMDLLIKVITTGFMGAMTIFATGVYTGVNAVNTLLQGMLLLGGAPPSVVKAFGKFDDMTKELLVTVKRMVKNTDEAAMGLDGVTDSAGKLLDGVDSTRVAVDGMADSFDRAKEAAKALQIQMYNAQQIKNYTKGEIDYMGGMKSSIRTTTNDFMGRRTELSNVFEANSAEAEAIHQMNVDNAGLGQRAFSDELIRIRLQAKDRTYREALDILKEQEEGLGLALNSRQFQMSDKISAILYPTGAPDKKGFNPKDGKKKPTGGGRARKEAYVDEEAMLIKSLQRQSRFREALELQLSSDLGDIFAQRWLDSTITEETAIEARRGLHAKFNDDIDKLYNNNDGADYIGPWAKAEEELREYREAVRELEDELERMARVDEELANEHFRHLADMQIASMALFKEIGAGALLTQILADKQAEAAAKFMTDEERKSAAIAKSNEAIISQITAFDGLQTSVSALATTQMEYERNMIGKTGDEAALLTQQNQVAMMGQVIDLAPQVASAFGASAETQLKMQLILNAALLTGALIMGNIPGIIAGAAGALTAAGSLAAMSALQTDAKGPELDEEKAAKNREQTKGAIVDALKDAGLYQAERQSIIVNQTGNNPVGFGGNKTRDRRNTNNSQNRNRRNRI